MHGIRGRSKAGAPTPRVSHTAKRPANRKVPPPSKAARKQQRAGGAAGDAGAGSPMEPDGFWGGATDPYDFFGG